MAISITMPRLSDTMEQGTVVKWHVKQGDSVSPGDVIADIETDKATMELEAFDEGTVAALSIDEGQTINVGETIVVLAEDGESAEEAAKSASSTASSSGAASTADTSAAQSGSDTPAPSSSGGTTAVAEPPASGSESTDRVFASPLARKIAEEHNINLGTINGSGPSGRIVKKDVEAVIGNGTAAPTAAPQQATPAAASAPAPAPMPAVGATLESRNVALNNMRATIAKRLVESKTTIPHYQVTISARMDSLMMLREELNEQLSTQGVKLSVNDFLVRACAIAMHQHPFVNSSWNPQGPSIDLHGHVNIGVAVALPEEKGGGLVVATINNADQIGLRQISSETKRLAKKARDKGLSPQELTGSTFTISNLGMFGVDHFTAIVNPPNAAILAVGRSIEKPFVEYDEDGTPELVVGHEMSMTISSDHRIIDGAMAAAYLNTVKQLLESPASLLV
ncbi:MAG: pyruvate dehydrogenase complex dihydrolipoamide acetyltransferase [Phycisphaerae bacterium]|nr:pyruvate dehydrogenase complex dihydrolipoamide acetyltransferase [Phycisphaerae bacterium]MBM91960.1 pyruvate dehydrogenase complex dihydrolipoamide acetyltransferase [Phycisphaerae bacterium]HCT43668.1 pyruvate dehydrogenase complex dihydrolipoamide acetyltransferase [Phycisphaerales bacterium]